MRSTRQGCTPDTPTTGRRASASSTARRRRGLYYAAFLLDPDGNNVEAVYRGEYE
jgi:hypothetical protein